jgi:hypothetical protein
MKKKIIAIGLILSLMVTPTLSGCGGSSSDNDNYSSGGCGYKYSDGSTCGASIGSHSPLCDYHFNQLDDTYNSVSDRMESLE